ncbi:hypothetical protein AB0C27_48305 [Nonomuraea sp. NPDC048882]|uniref:hypothetical protein n=1 Tax=unclassified Nonomuraea TaxID=2593643 RepID=UPI0033E5F3BE
MNTATLIRLILRRDRVWQPLWILSVTLFVATTVATIRELLPAPEALRQYVDEIAANRPSCCCKGRRAATAWARPPSDGTRR